MNPKRPHILVTRPAETASNTIERLDQLGFKVTHEPVLTVKQLSAELPVKQFDGLVLTSANAVPWLDAHWMEDRQLPVFVTGNGTADAARKAGFDNLMIAGGSVLQLAQNLPDLMSRLLPDRKNPCLLYPRAEVVAKDLMALLGDQKIGIEDVPVYATHQIESFSHKTDSLFQNGHVDMVMLFSARSGAAFSSLYEKLLGSDADFVPQNRVSFSIIAMSDAIRKVLPPWATKRTVVADLPSLDSMIATVLKQVRPIQGSNR